MRLEPFFNETASSSDRNACHNSSPFKRLYLNKLGFDSQLKQSKPKNSKLARRQHGFDGNGIQMHWDRYAQPTDSHNVHSLK